MVLTTMSIWRRRFWRSYWIALRRSREDKRARLFALKVSLALVYVLAYALMIFILPFREREGIWPIAFYGFIFGSGATAFFILRRSHRKQDEFLRYSLTGRDPHLPLESDISSTVRNYLIDRAIILASQVARAASEIYLHQHELAPGLEVVTRQTQNSLLRQNGLWEKLEPAEVERAMSPDGSWTEEQHFEAIRWCEHLRLLRWTIGVDAELVPLEHFPAIDFSLVNDLLGKESGDLANKSMLRPWDLRVERDIALSYTARVIAELKGRALIPNDVELDGWADQLRENSLGASIDYLAGSKTIGELSNELLRQLALVATTRERYAAYLVEQLSVENPATFAAWSAEL